VILADPDPRGRPACTRPGRRRPRSVFIGVDRWFKRPTARPVRSRPAMPPGPPPAGTDRLAPSAGARGDAPVR